MALDRDPNHVFRDFVTNGVPSSGNWNPRKPEIRQLLAEWWQTLIALVADAGGLELPNLLISMTVTGDDENNIVAEANLPVPSGPSLAVFSIVIVEANTGPVTINGKPLLSNTGNELVAGALAADGIYLFLDNGESYRLLSDYVSASIVAAAEDAASQAIGASGIAAAAAERAETAAAGVEFPVSYGAPQSLTELQKQQARNNIGAGEISDFATAADLEAATNLEATEFVSLGGFAASGDGGGGSFTKQVSEPNNVGKIADANGNWWQNVVALNLAQRIHETIGSGVIRVNCIGDSLTYGYDTTATGTLPPIHGSTATRSSTPYPDMLELSLNHIFSSVTVRNYGYPGDRAKRGYERWEGNLEPADVWFICYGTNETVDIDGFDTVKDFRHSMLQWIGYARSQGAVPVILLAPGLPSSPQAMNVRSFRQAAAEAAADEGVACIDIEEQIRHIARRWTDGSHLTPEAYEEWGAHLASLFADRGGRVKPVAGGSRFSAADGLGVGGVLTGSAAAVDGVFLHLDNDILTVGIDAKEDVIPIVRAYNDSGSVNRSFTIVYGGDIVAGRNYETYDHIQTGSLSTSRRFVGMRLRKGYRCFKIVPMGGQALFIERIDFVRPEDSAQSVSGINRPLPLICVVPPGQSGNFRMVDWSEKLAGAYNITTHIQAKGSAIVGAGILGGRDISSDRGSHNQLLWLRNGTEMQIYQRIAGVETLIYTAASAFAAGDLDVTVDMIVQPNGAGAFLVDGASKADFSAGALTIRSGFPMFVSSGANGNVARCVGATLTQY